MASNPKVKPLESGLVTLLPRGGGDMVSATFPEGAPTVYTKLDHAVFLAVSTAAMTESGAITKSGKTVALIGSHGIGKTHSVADTVSRLRVGPAQVEPKFFSLSAPNVVADHFSMQVPLKLTDGSWQSRQVLNQILACEEPFVLFVDDELRGSDALLRALNPVKNEGQTAGRRLDNLLCVITADNPAGGGYQTKELNFRAASRQITVEVDLNDTGWKHALAAKYAETDLSGVFAVMDEIVDPKLLHELHPRKLDQIIDVVLAGLPAEVAVDQTPKGPGKFLDSNGDDQTLPMLRNIVSALGVPWIDLSSMSKPEILRIALERKFNVHLIGPPGVAKSSFAAALAEPGVLDVELLDVEGVGPSDMVNAVPIGDTIRFIIDERFGDRKVPTLFVFDDAWQAHPATRAGMLELFGSRSLAGQKIENSAGFWMINNPEKIAVTDDEGKESVMRLPSMQVDRAFTSRFQVNLWIDADDLDWRDFLIAKYGEDEVMPFLKWRAWLQPVEKLFVPPRVLEALIQTHLHGGGIVPLESALPMLGKDRVPVTLFALRELLEGRQVFGFDEIIADPATYLSSMTDMTSDPGTRREMQATVKEVLERTEARVLEQHRDLVLDLVGALAETPDLKAALVLFGARAADQRLKKFWVDVFVALGNVKKAS